LLLLSQAVFVSANAFFISYSSAEWEMKDFDASNRTSFFTHALLKAPVVVGGV